MQTSQDRGVAATLGLHVSAIVLVLLLEAAALALVILLPRWLSGSAPSASQLFVFFLVGALAGYLAELVLRGMRPLGYASSILFGMVGAWIGSNILPKAPAWDWPLSTTSGNVPVVTSFVLALLLTLLWRAATGWSLLARRLQRAQAAVGRWLRQGAQAGLNSGLPAGLAGGATLGWGTALLYLQFHRPRGPGFFGPLLLVILTLGLLAGWWRLLQRTGFRLFGRPVGLWYGLALAGFCLGGPVFPFVVVLLHRAAIL